MSLLENSIVRTYATLMPRFARAKQSSAQVKVKILGALIQGMSQCVEAECSEMGFSLRIQSEASLLAALVVVGSDRTRVAIPA
jgi:hypothetical protein